MVVVLHIGRYRPPTPVRAATAFSPTAMRTAGGGLRYQMQKKGRDLTTKAAFSLMRDGDREFMQAFLGTLKNYPPKDFRVSVSGGEVFEYDLAEVECESGGYEEWSEGVEEKTELFGDGSLVVSWVDRNTTTVAPVPGMFGSGDGDVRKVYSCFGTWIRDETVRKQSVQVFREVAKRAYWGGTVTTLTSGGVSVVIEV